MTTTLFYDIVKEYFPDFLYTIIRSFNPLKTEHHQEEYHEHCYNTGINLDKVFKEKYPNLYAKYANKILGEYNMLHVVGFFHDIGKPFTCKKIDINKRATGTVKIIEKMTGHAQVGAYLVRRIFEDKIDEQILDIIVYCIDKHMCRNYIHSVELNKEYIPLLKCLFYADSISRKTCHESLFQEVKQTEIVSDDFKIIILPIGLQCCGKTTLSNDLKKQYDLIHIERDRLMLEIAKENNYRKAYNSVHSSLEKRKILKEMFKTSIETALLSDTKIIIIDTVMTLYRKVFKSVIDSMSVEAIEAYKNSIKLGFYLFPQHQFQAVDTIKVYAMYPNKYIDFPTVKGESEKGDLDIGTGNYKNLLNTIDNLLKNSKQNNLICLLKTMNLDDVIQNFKRKSVFYKEEFKNIFVVCYRDGSQTVSGITKDIRGEVVLLKENIYYLLRGTFPVFSEVSELKERAFKSNYEKIIATPKFDGSLVHITCIKKDDILYNDLLHLENIRETEKAIYLTGSKTVLITTDKIMLGKIEKAMSNVIDELDSFVIDKINYNRINFQFEVMTDKNSADLTVSYDKPFYKLLSYVVYDDNHKKIKLPDSFISEKMDTVDQYSFKNIQELKSFISNRHKKLVNGDNSIEPEGYVIHFVHKDNIVSYKYKYPEFYVAHKPSKDLNRTKQILSRMNKNLKDRFIKFNNLKESNDIKHNFFKKFVIIKDILNCKYDKKTLHSQLSENKSIIEALEKRIQDFNYCANFKKMKKVNLLGFIMRNSENDDIEEKIRDFYFEEDQIVPQSGTLIEESVMTSQGHG